VEGGYFGNIVRGSCRVFVSRYIPICVLDLGLSLSCHVLWYG
jgi:hypothetical protein